MLILDLRYDQELESAIAQLPTMPSILDSVTHVVCSPRVCGITSDELTSVKILRLTDTAGTLIDGGSNVCVTGDLHTLLDVTDITPVSISVALDGVPSSVDDKITKAVSCLLPFRMAPHTTKHASIAQTWSKPSSPPLLSLHQVTCSTTGLRKAARTLWSRVVLNSPATTASY